MPSPSRRAVLRSVAAVAAAGLAGCSSSCPDRDAPEPETVVRAGADAAGPFQSVPTGTWPAPRYGPGNAGYAPGTTPPGDPVGIRWRTRLATAGEGMDASSPAVADGRVFVAGAGGVVALDLRDGSERWRNGAVEPNAVPSTFEFDDEVAPPVAAPDGAVLVGGRRALTALDPDDGSVRWSYDATSSFSVPVAVGDAVYAAAAGGVVALDRSDGTERWTTPVDVEEVNLPGVADGTVVVADGSRTRALDAATGEPRWSVDRGVEDYPVVADGTVYLGAYEGLRALALADGRERWRFERGSGRAISAPVVAPEALYVVERPGEGPDATFALDRTDGTPSPRWCSYVAEGAATGAAGDQAFVVRPSAGFDPTATPSLVAFTDRFGEAPWGYATDRGLLPPAVLDGAVVLADRRGTVAAVGEV